MENILNILDKEIKRFEIQLNSKFINDKQGLNNNIITNLFLFVKLVKKIFVFYVKKIIQCMI